ncbi:hypothetical protein GCM10027075_11650 [Streptomyces heilongjiangensis]
MPRPYYGGKHPPRPAPGENAPPPGVVAFTTVTGAQRVDSTPLTCCSAALRCPRYGQPSLAPGIRLLYCSHDHDELPHLCDRGDHDARCSLYVSNVRLLEGPRTTP